MVLHTRPGGHQLFDSNQITDAIQAFGKNHEAAFVILEKAGNDTNRFVRAGAIYGMGELGKSVPEVTPFLWEVVYSSRNSLDRCRAFQSLQKIGFEPPDIPKFARLLSNLACNQNILTMLVPEAISGLIESNSPVARPYLISVESLLDDSDPDTQFRAALALVKSQGANNPKIFSALHELFQRPNNRDNKYYKMLAVQILGDAGPVARPLVPDLLEFAKLPDEGDTYRVVAEIAPELGAKIPEVAQVLKEQQREQRWTEKWRSGSYSFEDLRTALTDPAQALTAANHLAEIGVTAKAAVPEMIKALWGKDEDTRNKILADIHKIDPRVTVTKIDVDDSPFAGAFGSADSVLEKMPASPENNALKNACAQMMGGAGWVLPEELAAITNNLAVGAPAAYHAFLEGLKPAACVKPSTAQLPDVWTNH